MSLFFKGFIYFFVLVVNSLAQHATTEDLKRMSIYELLEVKIFVPGAITKLNSLAVTSSITVITQSEIKNTSARNIYDLLLIYVPGAFGTNYEKGPSLGIRGIIENRNLKYLLILNNRVINNKGHFWVKSELEMWDLNDIEKIEVIRGPGSVTYVPGAVAGVLRITTKSLQTIKKLE